MAGTVQNVVGALPIINRRVPVEGDKAAQVTATLAPTDFFVSQIFQLSDQSGLMMTQVVTLLVDNTAGNQDILVTHGVLQQKLTVPQGTQMIVPTFSAQGFYPLTVQAVAAPSAPFAVPMILLNYERQTGVYATPQSVNIVNATIPVAGNVNANITNASLTVAGSVDIGTISGQVTLNAASVIDNITQQVAIKQPTVSSFLTNATPTVTSVYPTFTTILSHSGAQSGAYILMTDQGSSGAKCYIRLSPSGVLLGEMLAGDIWQIGGVFFNFLQDWQAALIAGTSAVFFTTSW